MVRAVVLPALGADLELTDVDLPEPGPAQVRVRLAAAGVCHSDLSLANGILPQRAPVVLGHEGSGTVAALGEGVTSVRVGQRVLLNWAPSCRTCHFCVLGEPWLCERAGDAAAQPYARLADGSPVYAGLGTAAFAEETVVPAHAAIPLPDGLELDDAALLGCAVLTAFGAVHAAARVRRGQSAVVVGLGGVGLAVLQSLRIAGAHPVVAVDVSAAKEGLARSCGASHFVFADEETAKQVRSLTGGFGADQAFECVGRASAIRLAWSSTRRGGATTVVGVGPRTEEVRFSALELFSFARTLRGCVHGNLDPDREVPVLAGHVRAGRLRPADLITDRIGLDGIPEAFERMRRGVGGRSLVTFA